MQSEAETMKSRAMKQREAAELWIRKNRDAWEYIASRALHYADTEQHFTFREIWEDVRKLDIASINGDTVKCNNNHSPALERLLIEQHPEVRPFMEIRRAVCDLAFHEVA